MNKTIHDSSFRDPNGHIFYSKDGLLYRQINKTGAIDYDQLMRSGLYHDLVGRNWLISHQEVDNLWGDDRQEIYKIIKPSYIPFISYPYEWSFSQLKDAALRALDIQMCALKYNMVLRDASAYNMQYNNGAPILIDTLSFECYQEGKSWVAYRQFCQHFLAPLLLMSKCDIRLSQLSKIYIDGVPLDLASTLLPLKTWFQSSIAMHLHLHAKMQTTYASSESQDKAQKRRFSTLSRNGMISIITSLKKLVQKLEWKPYGTEWADYYQNNNYSDDAFEEKRKIITGFVDKIVPKTVWDVGANTGIFSRIASDRNIPTIAFDIDPAAVELNYINAKKNKESKLLPLIMDLTNPSPSLGWSNNERQSLIERGGADCVFALALIHHLAITNNVPLANIASFFTTICTYLIIEFVPKSDSQVKRLLSTRQDIFFDYTIHGFERAFARNFDIVYKVPIFGTERILYLFKNKVRSKRCSFI